MTAASWVLPASLLLRAAVGLGDDVLLLQQMPDGPLSRALETPSQDFEAFATNGDGEQWDEEQWLEGEPASAVVQQAGLSVRVVKPKHGRKHFWWGAHRQHNASMASLATGNLTAKETRVTASRILQLVGIGQCVDAYGNRPTSIKMIPGMTYSQCAEACSDNSLCESVDFLSAKVNVRALSECNQFSLLVTKYSANADMYCFYKTNPPQPTATANGDPHLQNMRGTKFDVRRPGNHTFLVVPQGAGVDNASLYVWADVTPLDGKMCKYQTGLFITELTLTGSWLKPMGGSLRLSTGTKEFNTPSTWGLSIGGSRNLSLQEFTSRLQQLPLHMASINATNPERPNTNKKNHVDTMRLKLNAGPSHLTVGWAHTQDPMSNWLWLSVNGVVGSGKLGGLLGEDDHTWVTKPLECEGP